MTRRIPRPTPPPEEEALSQEEAVQRHADGDHSPEVLAALNLAAWDAFHAPWEPTLTEPTMADEPLEPAPLPDPALPRPLTLDLLQTWADKAGYSAFQHPNRGLLVDFRYGLAADRCVELRARISGKGEDILLLQLCPDRRVPPQDFTRALRLCNDWNQEYRWPRASVEQEYRSARSKDEEDPAPEVQVAREATHSGRLVLDFQVRFSEGIHPAGLEAILDDVVSTSWDFWRLAQDKWGL